MDSMFCPRCNCQGQIHHVRIKAAEAYLCDECEAIWLQKEDIGTSNYDSFHRYMKSQELRPLWTELEIITIQ